MHKSAIENFIIACGVSSKKEHQHLYILLSHIPAIIEECAIEGKFEAVILAKNFGIPDSTITLNQDLIMEYVQEFGYTMTMKEIFIKEFDTFTELVISWDFLKQ